MAGTRFDPLDSGRVPIATATAPRHHGQPPADCRVSPDEDVGTVLEWLSRGRAERVEVVDEAGRVLGVLDRAAEEEDQPQDERGREEVQLAFWYHMW